MVSVALCIVSKDVKFYKPTTVTAPVYDFKWGRLEIEAQFWLGNLENLLGKLRK
jgi:hypothetical protein